MIEARNLTTEAFMQLTEESVDYRSHKPAMAGAA